MQDLLRGRVNWKALSFRPHLPRTLQEFWTMSLFIAKHTEINFEAIHRNRMHFYLRQIISKGSEEKVKVFEMF
jgi:hypothetical protein